MTCEVWALVIWALIGGTIGAAIAGVVICGTERHRRP
jgi:hypothetical protein